jgi:hypothetical protein
MKQNSSLLKLKSLHSIPRIFPAQLNNYVKFSLACTHFQVQNNSCDFLLFIICNENLFCGSIWYFNGTKYISEQDLHSTIRNQKYFIFSKSNFISEHTYVIQCRYVFKYNSLKMHVYGCFVKVLICFKGVRICFLLWPIDLLVLPGDPDKGSHWRTWGKDRQ